MKHAREEQKYKDYAKKFGTKSTAGPGPKRAKNRKRHSSEKLSYEKGEPEEFDNHSDEDQV